MSGHPCTTDGCDKPGLAKTQPSPCGGCRKRIQRRGTTDRARAPQGSRTICGADGCDRAVSAHGWCGVHRLRVERHGDPRADVPIREKDPDRGCAVEGCGRPHTAKGWCERHYHRAFRSGRPNEDRPIQARPFRDPVCSVDGCGRAHLALGLCSTHYSRRWRATQVAAVR